MKVCSKRFTESSNSRYFQYPQTCMIGHSARSSFIGHQMISLSPNLHIILHGNERPVQPIYHRFNLCKFSVIMPPIIRFSHLVFVGWLWGLCVWVSRIVLELLACNSQSCQYPLINKSLRSTCEDKQWNRRTVGHCGSSRVDSVHNDGT